MTVSSTCCATSAARCCADHVAGNSRFRLRVTTMPTAGVTTSAISVSTGDIHSIATNDSSAKITEPNDSGICIRIPVTSCRSEIARETTWPVRRASCLPPSRRDTALNTRWRRSCWTSSASLPPKYRRRNAVANATSCNVTRTTAMPGSAPVCPATASSTAARTSSGLAAWTPTLNMAATSDSTTVARCSHAAADSLRTQPTVSAGGSS